MEIKIKYIKPCEQQWRQEPPLQAFDLESIASPRISFVGAGGKTSTLEALARDYRTRGRQAIVTTTTHMLYPQKEWVLTDCEDIVYIQKKLQQHTVLWVGKPCENGKIKEVSEELKAKLLQLPCPLLAEADGSRRLPFKIPGDREPVLFPQTTCVFGVLGLDALHKKIGEVSFRSEKVAALLGKTIDDVLEEDDFVEVIKSSQGLKKQVAPDMEFKVILNKADNEERTAHALSIRDKLDREIKTAVYITSHH